MSPIPPLCSPSPGSSPTPGPHFFLDLGGIVVSKAAFQVDSSVLDSTERKSFLGYKCTKKHAETISPYSGPDLC